MAKSLDQALYAVREQADQRAFFDKALIGALSVVGHGTSFNVALKWTNEELDRLVDTAVTIALKITLSRQVQLDNDEI